MFTGLQALKLWGVLSSWDTLNSLPMKVSPVLLGLSAAVWVALGVLLAWGIWCGRPWASKTTQFATIAFAGVHWIDRLFLQFQGPQTTNWLFDLVLSSALLAAVFSILTLPAARIYFGEMHE
jgi:hypothetical protein